MQLNSSKNAKVCIFFGSEFPTWDSTKVLGLLWKCRFAVSTLGLITCMNCSSVGVTREKFVNFPGNDFGGSIWQGAGIALEMALCSFHTWLKNMCELQLSRCGEGKVCEFSGQGWMGTFVVSIGRSGRTGLKMQEPTLHIELIIMFDPQRKLDYLSGLRADLSENGALQFSHLVSAF